MSDPAIKRDARLDWLRGFAAILVLVHHLFAPLDWSGQPVLASLGRVASWLWLGVPIFFVLSGRCIGETWLRSDSPGRFAWRRIKRIYPPYLASLLVCAGVILARKLVTGVNDVSAFPRAPREILATLFLATAPATSVPTVNWVYWSLTYEVVFYALLAALLVVCRRPAHRAPAWLGLHAFLCLLHLAGLAAPSTPGFFLEHWPLFGLGFGLALVPANRRAAFASLGISAVHLIALAVLARANLNHAAGLASAAALTLPARIWSPAAGGLLPRIGVFSYSLYLVHVPVGVFLLLLPCAARLGPGLAGLSCALLVSALGSLAAGYVFHVVAERPWMSRPALAP